jgi:hypothetical protein
MQAGYFVKAGLAAFTTGLAGPTLYDVCDPLLHDPPEGTGDAHLRKFYHTALRNIALRPLLARAGLPQLRDPARLSALRQALTAARDAPDPGAQDWWAIGAPVAALIDEFPQRHPRPPPAATGASAAVPLARIDVIIRACAADLLRSFSRNGFIPAYAAFNLAGDPDLHGRDLLVALTGLNARSYRNATLLFNLARVFILANPALAALINPPWRGIAEPIWEPVQIRHRSAYYSAFFAEALMDFLGSGLAAADEAARARGVVKELIAFCLKRSREQVRGPENGAPIDVVTALVQPPHVRLSKFFWRLKSELGFGSYVPDCDTTACSFSAATQFGACDAMLDQPLLDFYAQYQVGHDNNRNPPTVALNDTIAYDGGIVTWIENEAGERPFGNDLDPTLNLDVLEVAFRNHARWQIAENPKRLETVRRIVRFQGALIESGAFADPRAHIYYLPELYCAYAGRCVAAFAAMPQATRATVDPDGVFARLRAGVLDYVREVMLPATLNPFDAALALLALAKLHAEPAAFAPALSCLDANFGEGRGLFARSPYKAYEWNKMKTPTRILVGGPEVTSAFVLSALVHARKQLAVAAAADLPA